MGWAGMDLTELIVDLDSHLKAGEKELEALHNLLLSSRISQSTYDLVEKKINHENSLVSELKEALVAEEGYWQNIFSDATRMLEFLLVELEHRHLLGEISEEELTQKSNVVNLGLTALVNKEASASTLEQEFALPVQTTLEKHTIKEGVAKQMVENKIPVPAISEEEKENIEHTQTENTHNGGQASNRRRTSSTKESPELEALIGSTVHCMNPWNPECRNTDIELSIYYKGRSTPICRKCWEEISDKNVEWSSL
jgi:predicted RNase H-like nuclease (RuvC/YqgF family)